MKKLLFITTVPVTLRSFLLPYAEYFQRLGMRVDAAATGITECGVCRDHFDAVFDLPWSRNPFLPFRFLQACRILRRRVEEKAYDLVHVHTPVAAFVTRWALRSLRDAGRIKVIYTAHGFHFHAGGSWGTNALFLKLEKLAGRWTDALVVINRDDHKSALRHHLVPAARLFYIPGIGVDRDYYAPERVSASDIASIRQELRLKAEDVLFLIVGEYTANKRSADALRALRALPPQAHLALAGEGPMRPSLERLANRLGIKDRVHLLGWRRDIPALVRASRALLLFSAREGLPRSIMEALCLQTPVIGTDIRGTRDLVGPDCGMLVPVGDIPAITQAMEFFLQNSTEAEELGRRGREKMVQYDLPHLLQHHEELYLQTLGLRSSIPIPV